MSIKMPKDDSGEPIPCIKTKEGKAHKIAVSATSARNSTAFELTTTVISFYADTNVYFEFGNDSVEADNTCHYMPAGVYYNFSLNDRDREKKYTHIAVIRDTEDGNVFISECE